MGDPAFGAPPKGDFTFPFFISGIGELGFRMEVHDSEGELQRILALTTAATIEVRLNQPEQITLMVSAQDVAEQGLFENNEIWLFDQNDRLGLKTVIRRREEIDNTSGQNVAVMALGYLAQWGQEEIFNVTEEDLTIGEILDDLISSQTLATPLTLGTIDPGIASVVRPYSATSPRTLLSVIRDLEKSLPTETIFFVAENRQFFWLDQSFVVDNNLQLRIGSNLVGALKDIDWSRQTETIVAYNGTFGDNQLTSTQSATFAGYKARKMFTIASSEFADAGDPAFELEFITTIPELSRAAANGSDIKFLADDLETELSFVLNSFTQATGAIDADITLGSVSGVEDTVFYMIWDIT